MPRPASSQSLAGDQRRRDFIVAIEPRVAAVGGRERGADRNCAVARDQPIEQRKRQARDPSNAGRGRWSRRRMLPMSGAKRLGLAFDQREYVRPALAAARRAASSIAGSGSTPTTRPT